MIERPSTFVGIFGCSGPQRNECDHPLQNHDFEGDIRFALGAGDEGKGSGYQTDAYIKKQPDDTNGDNGGGLGDGGPAPAPQDETQDYTPFLIGGGVILLIALLS